jgi:hypothetical protein
MIPDQENIVAPVVVQEKATRAKRQQVINKPEPMFVLEELDF